MELYFGKPAKDSTIVLDKEESNHLINVKRSGIGDIVHVTDGEGNLYTTELLDTNKRSCTLSINGTEKSIKRNFRLHLAIAPTKSIDRMEWFLEKAVETGIDEITFLLCRHSERKEIKEDRLKRVMISAMKQSMKTFLPKINPMIDYKNFISKSFPGICIICTTNEQADKNFKDIYQPANSLLALIGPEGDFHPEELEAAIQNNFIPASLGKSRLRTETAALNVCTIFNFINS